MNDTSRMVQLLKRIRVEMNGAVVEGMEARGILYPLNYGVSIPTLKDIAAEQEPSHSLALLLYQQDVRELKLMAVFLDRPEWVTLTQIQSWATDFTNTEIIEHATGLLAHAGEAADAINAWLASGTENLGYAASLMLMKRLRTTNSMPLEDVERCLFGIFDMTENISLGRTTLNGFVAALRQAAQYNPILKTRIGDRLKKWQDTDNKQVRYIVEELMWQLEYMD